LILLLINLSSSPVGIESYYWDFDDGATSTATHPNHTFATAGLFNVKLIVTDLLGCIDSISKPVEVFEVPAAAFEATTACLGDSTVFTDLTTPAGASWNWSFGDGGTSNLQNPKHLYAGSGTFSVLLQVEDINGCSGSIVQEIEVYPLPIVNFTWNYAACANDTIFFEDLSQGIDTDITGWDWDFGDGTAHSTEQHPWHIYPSSGDTIYDVTLIVTTGTACTDTLTQEVNINGGPQAAFSVSNNEGNGPCINNQFSFTDESTTQSGFIQSWFWDFGDGTSTTLSNPIHFYESAGVFDVILTVTNTAGCTDSTLLQITVFDLPLLDFSFDTVCVGDTTHFNDSDHINVAATELWDYAFGDGASTTLSNPTHIYTAPSTYNVILQITDTNLCKNSIQHEVPVYGLPQVDFTFDTACLGLPTQYTDLTIIADHELSIWDWEFGDGLASGETSPQHTFSDFGIYNTKLIVSDAWGCTDSVQKTVRVFEPPIAQFSWSDTACASGLIHFTDESYHNQGFVISEFLWNMDDFETNIQNPQYHFPDVDITYPVSLTITDARGCTDTIIQDVYVAPELSITFLADTVCYGRETRLIAQTIAPADAEVSQWTWYFDDGSPDLTTSEDTIYHAFSGSGTFRVELQALEANSNGCTAEIEKNVKVRNLPIADFTAEPASCADSTLFLEESISAEGQILQWRWYFNLETGDMEIIDAPDNPDTKFLYPPFLETYEASLAITDEYGCIDSVTHDVQRFPCIFVNFYTDTNLYCQNKVVTFIDSTINENDAVVVDKYWNFGDGYELITGPNTDTVRHIYEETGVYEVAFAIKFNVNGELIADTIRKTITVYPTPIADLLAQNVCDQQEALLVSNTNANSSIVQSWTWYFGDGTQETIIGDEVSNAVYHTYPTSGTYDLQLMVLTDLGCRDTAQRDFVVNPIPQISFIADTTEVCGPNTILFTDSSSIESGSIINRSWDYGIASGETSTELDTISHFFNPKDFPPIGGLDDEFAAAYYHIKLTATSDSLCSASDSIADMIVVYSLPVPAFTVYPDSVAITNIEDIFLTNLSDNAYFYNWSLADTIIWEDSYEPEIWEEIKDTGAYSIQLFAETKDGCWDSTEQILKVYPVFKFFIPNAFSPNDNGINETFGPRGAYFNDKTYKFHIFNRWGELMFETTDFFTQWDGDKQKDGSKSPMGVYAWVIEITDLQGNVEVYRGQVTLVL